MKLLDVGIFGQSLIMVVLQISDEKRISKGHFFSDHSTLTNKPDAKTQLSLIFLKVWAFKG